MARKRAAPKGESLEAKAKKRLVSDKPKASSDKPKGAGGQKRLTAEKRAARNRELVLDRVVRGMSWATVAAKYELDETMCRRIVAAYREENLLGLDEIEPNSEVWELLAGHDAQIERYYELRETALDAKNLNAVIGAEKGIRDTRQARTQLLQEVGALPKNLGTLQVQHEVRVVVQKVMSVLDAVESGDLEPREAKRELLRLIGSRRTDEAVAAASSN